LSRLIAFKRRLAKNKKESKPLNPLKWCVSAIVKSLVLWRKMENEQKQPNQLVRFDCLSRKKIVRNHRLLIAKKKITIKVLIINEL
jgi:hypothetical protein